MRRIFIAMASAAGVVAFTIAPAAHASSSPPVTAPSVPTTLPNGMVVTPVAQPSAAPGTVTPDVGDCGSVSDEMWNGLSPHLYLQLDTSDGLFRGQASPTGYDHFCFDLVATAVGGTYCPASDGGCNLYQIIDVWNNNNCVTANATQVDIDNTTCSNEAAASWWMVDEGKTLPDPGGAYLYNYYWFAMGSPTAVCLRADVSGNLAYAATLSPYPEYVWYQ